jgi:hypothetical protein
MSWQDAMALKVTYADKTDWRLPTKDELLSNYTKPTIFTQAFPNTPSVSYWSSSSSLDIAWVVFFYDGSYISDYKYANHAVRYVRSQ